MDYFNAYGFINFNNGDILFRAPDAPRKSQNPKPHNPRVLPDIQIKIRAPSSRKLIFPALELRTPPRATKRQRARKASVQNKKLSAVCRSLFREELTDQTKSARDTHVQSVYRKLQLLCKDIDNTNTNKDMNKTQQDTRQQDTRQQNTRQQDTRQQDTRQQFAGAQPFHLHDMQTLDAVDQQKTPEAGSLNACSDEKEKDTMASVHYEPSDEEEHDLSGESHYVLNK